jgi:hypothetical protein
MLQPLMRTMIIELVHVLADHGPRVPLVVDQYMVEALLAQAAAPALDEAVRPRRAGWGLDHRDGLGGEDAIEGGGYLPSRSRMRNRNLLARSPRSIITLRACWATQSPVGWAVTPSRWTRRVATSITTSRYSRRSKTVSRWKKSIANKPWAWLRGPGRTGAPGPARTAVAGPEPAAAAPPPRAAGQVPRPAALCRHGSATPVRRTNGSSPGTAGIRPYWRSSTRLENPSSQHARRVLAWYRAAGHRLRPGGCGRGGRLRWRWAIDHVVGRGSGGCRSATHDDHWRASRRGRDAAAARVLIGPEHGRVRLRPATVRGPREVLRP